MGGRQQRLASAGGGGWRGTRLAGRVRLPPLDSALSDPPGAESGHTAAQRARREREQRGTVLGHP